MKILCVADTETRELWDHWDTAGRSLTEGVQLILSAGDIRPEYLEFLVTMLSVPCLYIRGNHDGRYDTEPPEGCICIEDEAVYITEDSRTGFITVEEDNAVSRLRRLFMPGKCFARVAGLGGSMRYREGPDMYTEDEMAKRVRRLRRLLRRMPRSGTSASDGKRGVDGTGGDETSADAPVRILLTHAPSFGCGDLQDLPHRGFACFNDLIEQWHPDYHLYGHVHMEYGHFERGMVHPAGTMAINISGMYILDI
ncbi:MAG: metallophosphoesterase [Mogibacterium sp.]|nr:metallophosphoesterase [Mogibacterium sp.]